MKYKLLLLFIVIGLIGFVLADLTGDIGDVEKNITKPNIIYSISTPLSENRIIQIQADPYINCPVENNQIVCYPMTPEAKANLTASLGIIPKIELKLLGIPVYKGGIFPSFISPDKNTIIPIDLSDAGTITIGFNTNIYEITPIANGITNNTQILSGILYLSGNNLTGEWYSGIADLNTTKTISNISYVSTEPSGSDIYNYVRTHNLTNGNLSDGITYYLKMDDGTLKDYSGFNRIGTTTNGFTVNGKFNGGFSSSGTTGGGAQLENYDINPNKNFTVSLWLKRNSISSSTNQYIIDDRSAGMANTSNYVFFIRISTSNLMSFYIYNESGVSPSKNIATITDTNWHNVIVGYNGTAYIYLDRVYIGAITLSGLPRNGSNAIKVGRDYVNANVFNGTMDEVMVFNRSLTKTEILDLNNTEKYAWSSYSSGCNIVACSVSVADGRYVQVKSALSRSGSENVYENSISLGYTDIGGAPPAVDNPPTSTLTTTDGQTFNINNATLTGTQTDDIMLKNVSIWTNTTGTWAFNQSVDITGTSNSTGFVVRLIPEGTYKYNIQVCDNSSQCVWASANKTFTIALTCVDSNCYPYMCKPDKTCYTSCNAHTQCNSSSYCSLTGSCLPALQDTSECANKEWSGLTDNEICINQATGWCYNDNVGTVGEYCAETSTACVNDGTQYTQGSFICQSPNDAFQCLGGESYWSSLIDCKDLGDSYSQTATYHSGGYCGYYNAETCSSGGCTPAVPATQDCGSYYYTGSTCGIGASSCDIGCGATDDLSTCPSGLSSDCNTCSPPTEDNPPSVTLSTPLDSSTQTTTAITFGYKVLEDFGINNCSLWLKTATSSWDLNQTNTTTIIRDGITINYFNQNFNNLDSITWNVNCYDNNSQLGYGDTNYTFTINTAFQETFKPLRIFNGSESTAELFSIDENGNVFIKGNLNLNNSNSNINLSNLGVNVFDLTSLTTTGIRFSNPYSNYLKINGKTGGSLLFNLIDNNPQITTDTGDFITIGKALNISGNTAIIGNLRVTGSISGTSLTFNSINVTSINSGGGPVYIGGEYEVGGITIQNGQIFAQNLTLPSGTYLLSSGIINNGSIFPSVNNTYDIGNTSLIWRRGFFRGLNITGDDVYINGQPASGLFNNASYLSTYNATYASLNTSQWATFGGDIYYQNLTGNVGIGTATPANTLTVSSSAATPASFIGTTQSYIKTTISGSNSVSFGASSYGSGAFRILDNAGSRTLITILQTGVTYLGETGQKVAIGSLNTPAYLLEINNSAKALNVSGLLYVNTTNVGVGTSTPSQTLDVRGAGNFSGTIYINNATDINTAFAKYQFLGNNFNGSGNFTTTGRIGIGTETFGSNLFQINATVDSSSTTTIQIYPTADYAVSALIKPSTGTSHYAMVDESAVNDSDWVNVTSTATTTPVYDLFDMGDPGVSGTIASVVVYYRGNISGSGASGSLKPMVISPVYNGTETFISEGSSTTYTQTWTTNPQTGVAWTWSDINALRVGVHLDPSETACLPGNSLIKTPNGNIEISKLKEGDKIYSYNENKKTLEIDAVIKFYKSELGSTITHYIFNKNLDATFDHVIYTNKGWIKAEDIKIGDVFLDSNLNKIKVESIKTYESNEPVYDISVEKNHNFFAQNMLVHNPAPGNVYLTQMYAEITYYAGAGGSNYLFYNGNILSIGGTGSYKMGIGTTAPTHTLNVVGTSNITSTLWIGSNLTISGTITNTNASAYGGTTGYVLCFFTGGKIGHCSTTPTNGQCTCLQN